MSTSENHQRRTVCYAGRVQGVGFRYTTRSIASRFEITGYVRNLSNGRVELVAEGESRVLERFLEEVRDQMGAHIRDEKIDVQPASGQFTQFEIQS